MNCPSFHPQEPLQAATPTGTVPIPTNPVDTTASANPSALARIERKSSQKKIRKSNNSAILQAQALRHLQMAIKLLNRKRARPRRARMAIHGGLGAKDHCELRVNDEPPIRVERREHTLLLILAWFAKCSAAASQEGPNALPPFLPAKVIAEIVYRLTLGGGPLAGRWPYPTADDIYHSANEIRGLLDRRGLNRTLIETGERPSGYRLSTPARNITLKDAGPSQKFWATMFASVLPSRGGSAEENSGSEKSSQFPLNLLAPDGSDQKGDSLHGG